ncbi:MAG: hypothetical protein ABGX16_11600 [Pirellulales bacterium]
MKALLPIVLSCLMAMGGDSSPTAGSLDKQTEKLFFRLYAINPNGKNRYALLLPRLKREFLPFAGIVIDRRQSWQPIKNAYNLVEQIRMNALPRRWDHNKASQWAHKYATVLSQLKDKND